jgi:endoglucanase
MIRRESVLNPRLGHNLDVIFSYIGVMKQIVLTILAVLTALLFPRLAGAETIVLKRGLPTDIWLTWPSGKQLDEPKYVDVFPEYRQEFKGGEFKLVKDAGFDFVRLTIDPAIYLHNRTWEKSAQLHAGVKIAIDEILAAGLKVNLDAHIIPREGNDPGTEQLLKNDDSFDTYLFVVAILAKLAETYPADKVSFEPMNEPTLDCAYDLNGAWPRWPDMLARMHKTARLHAPKTTLVLSGGCWGGAEGLAALDPTLLHDENIIWSFHSYDPFVFSHQGASWTTDVVGYVSGLSFPPVKGSRAKIEKAAIKRIGSSGLSARDKKTKIKELDQYLDRYFEPGAAVSDAKKPFTIVANWAKAHNIPASRILLGEFGVIRGDKYSALSEEARAPLLELKRREAEKYGFAWSCWSWGGSFGISRDDKARAFSPVLLNALGLP